MPIQNNTPKDLGVMGLSLNIDKLDAPWLPEQVEALNRWQRRGDVHPFTCVNDHGEAGRDLIATADGWICRCCDYRQTWAFSVMAV